TPLAQREIVPEEDEEKPVQAKLLAHELAHVVQQGGGGRNALIQRQDDKQKTGPQAQQAAEALHARSFTHNGSLSFSENAYRPHTKAGRQLIAHALVHTTLHPHIVARQPAEDNAVEKAVQERWKKIFGAQQLMWADLRDHFPGERRKL